MRSRDLDLHDLAEEPELLEGVHRIRKGGEEHRVDNNGPPDFLGERRQDGEQVPGPAKECTVIDFVAVQECGCFRTKKFDIVHARFPCGFRCQGNGFGPQVERVYFFREPGHSNRDFAGPAADLKDRVGFDESQFSKGDCHDLVLGRTTGEFLVGHLHKFWCRGVLRIGKWGGIAFWGEPEKILSISYLNGKDVGSLKACYII